MRVMRLINYLEALMAAVVVTNMGKAGFFDKQPTGRMLAAIIGIVSGGVVGAFEPLVQRAGRAAPTLARHSFSIAAGFTASFITENIILALQNSDSTFRAKCFANALTCYIMFTAGYLINPQ